MDYIKNTNNTPLEPKYYTSFTAEEFEGYERRMNDCRSPGSKSPDSDDSDDSSNSETKSRTQLYLNPKSNSGVIAMPEAGRHTFIDETSKVSLANTSSSTLAERQAQKDPKLPEQSSVIAVVNELKDEVQLALPAKRQSQYIRAIRHTLWNVYRRLFSIVFLANVAALIAFFCKTTSLIHIDLWHFATAASANIFVGTAIRQDYIQIILYRTAWLVPQSAPLRLRTIVAKLYENGGVHSGCGVAGAMWFTALTVMLTIQFAHLVFTSVAVLALTYVLQTLFMTVLALAYPSLRAKYHNAFEVTHRFLGWTIIILFWVELGLLASINSLAGTTSIGKILIEQPSFWFLILITIHTILPWLNLRRWEFSPENLSKHAVRLHFKQTVSPYTGIAISKSPLLEWHPFATMPSLSGEPTGGSLIVSSAGDWTKQTVESPKTSYWVKGFPKPGVLGMSLIFQRVVVVTTGSGIGPCLSILASKHRRTECRVLWSSPSPLGIFGDEIVSCVRRVDPDARIIDTKREGRPDMVMLAYQMYTEANAEAVFVISNPGLTRRIVYSMESRGVPAFGPVWDS